MNRKNQTLKKNCVEHFVTMFAAKQPPQTRLNSSKLLFFRRNNHRSKVSFEENTPSGGSHGIEFWDFMNDLRSLINLRNPDFDFLFSMVN